MNKDYPLVLVRWQDARIDTNWTPLSRVLKEVPSTIESYGLLIQKNRKQIILAQSVTKDVEDTDESFDIMARLKIPRQWVMEIILLGIIEEKD